MSAVCRKNAFPELVEPVRQLFKDEVRQAGLQLGLPKEIVYRQPFPGPGLAVRILGEVTPERLRILRDADRIVVSEMKASDWYYRVWQSFAVLLPVRSVGVMGDQRTYEHTIAIRVVESCTAVTAGLGATALRIAGAISSRSCNEVSNQSRLLRHLEQTAKHDRVGAKPFSICDTEGLRVSRSLSCRFEILIANRILDERRARAPRGEQQ